MSTDLKTVLIVLLVLAGFVPAQTKPSTRPHNFARWEKAIAAYEAKDKVNPPAKGGVVFIGSSTIARWKTVDKDFPGINAINRGFGGSEMIDAAHFADRIVTPYEPRMVLVRAGTNDIRGGKSAEQVFEDYKAFVAAVRGKLPDVPIVYISNAPAPIRWDDREETKKLNDLVKDWTATQKNLKYVETYDTTITPDGKPREELFVQDRLHFNTEGYKLLIERVRPMVMAK